MRPTDKQLQKMMTAMNTSGLFITCGNDPPNIMSTHWGTVGTMWNRDVFVLPVRQSKFSHEILDKTGEFAICMPIKDMRDEIMMCDSLSGYKENKFERLHLHPRRARGIDTYILAECGLIFECKVLLTADMEKDKLAKELLDEMYAKKDVHTLYFAEITDVYTP